MSSFPSLQNNDNAEDELLVAFSQKISLTTVEAEETVTISTKAKTTTTKKPTTGGYNKFRGKNPNVKWKSFSVQGLNNHHRFLSIEKQQEEQAGMTTSGEVKAIVVEQRSEEWFKQRMGRLTGSQSAKALGFFATRNIIRRLGLKPDTYHRQGELSDFYFNLNFEEEKATELYRETVFGPVQQVFMDWGTHHESNAILTFLDAFSKFKVQETGFWAMDRDQSLDMISDLIQKHPNVLDDASELCLREHLPLIGASPDGIILDENHVPVAVLEIKCPTPFVPASTHESSGEFQYIKRKPHDKIPVYYLPQMMLQMFVTKLQTCFYCSFTVTGGSNIFELTFDSAYFLEMLYWFARFNEEYKNNEGGIRDEDVFMKTFEADARYLAFVDKGLEIVQNCAIHQVVQQSQLSNEEPIMFFEE